ncbi:endolytic transglycosylase MltG [Anaeromicropila populeti]|uniref:YceG-like family protein n=1 Tax=Anaeromicropila populeti TaxID=37658 RepID=A0A1I6KXR0_9FIRM|nr:endolytic transglycosylase MltG [Anaeromicropila populeti]SFR95995.1 YceG-like family protein [Anaeromicropila populeti]
MKWKYYLRGLGIGILCTTILFTLSNSKRNKELSEDEIISYAREMGLYTLEEAKDALLEESIVKLKEEATEAGAEPTPQSTVVPSESQEEEAGEESSPQPSVKPSAKPSAKPTSTPQPSKEPAKVTTISVTIEPGMTLSTVAKYFYQAGVVGSAEDFKEYMSEQGLDAKIRTGEYEIPINASYKEIVDIIS